MYRKVVRNKAVWFLLNNIQNEKKMIFHVPVMVFAAALLLFVTFVGVHVLALHVNVLNWPCVWQVAVPPPE